MSPRVQWAAGFVLALAPACATASLCDWASDEDASCRGVRMAVAIAASPMTVALDAITLPVQLIAFPVIVAHNLDRSMQAWSTGALAGGLACACSFLPPIDPGLAASAQVNPCLAILCGVRTICSGLEPTAAR